MIRADAVIQYVNLSKVLGDVHYIELMTQISAVKTACAAVLQTQPAQIKVMIGGTDAYKLITGTYHASTDIPLEIFVDFDEALDEEVKKEENQVRIMSFAYNIRPTLQGTFVNLGKTPFLSNGQFRIDSESGRVFHPFPKTFIHSSVFLNENIIITPDLRKMIQDANNPAAFELLASVFKTYYIWLQTGKILSEETADILVAFFKDTSENTVVIRHNLDLRIMHILLTHPSYEAALTRYVTQPLTTDLENLKAEHAIAESTIKAVQEKASFAAIIHNLTSQKLEQTITENNALKNDNATLSQEKQQLEEDLKKARDTISSLEKQSQENETTHQTTENTAAARITELETQLINANKIADHEKTKNKQLAKDNTALIIKSEKLNKDLQEQDTAHQTELNKLKSQITSLQSGMATLTRHNNSLKQTVADLKAPPKPAKKAAPVVAIPEETAQESPAESITIEATTPADTALDTIKRQFVWYIIKMLNSGEVPIVISKDVLAENYVNLSDSDRASVNQCMQYTEGYIESEEEAIVAAIDFNILYSNIKTLEPNQDIDALFGQIMLELDHYRDTIYASQNTFTTAEQRIPEYCQACSVLLKVLVQTNSNPNAASILTQFVAIEKGEKLIAHLDAVSNTHHFLIKNIDVIRKGALIFKDSLQNPNSEIAPGLIDSLPEAAPFFGELLKYQGNRHANELGIIRFFKTIELLSETDTSSFSPTEFKNLLFIFSQLYRFQTAQATCNPILKEHFACLKITKKANANNTVALSTLTSNTYTQMIRALKEKLPNLNPKTIIELYFYAILRCTENAKKPQIGFDAPLSGIVTRLVSIDFIRLLQKEKSPDLRIMLIHAEINRALAAVRDNSLLFVPETERLHYLYSIVDLAGSWPMHNAELNVYMEIHTILKEKCALQVAQASAQPNALPIKDIQPPVDFKIVKKQITFSIIKAIQQMNSVSITALEGKLSYSLSVTFDDIAKLPPAHVEAVDALSKHLPDITSLDQAKDTLYFFCECLFLASYVKSNPSEKILTLMSNALNHLDNSKALLGRGNVFSEPAVKRFVFFNSQFQLINNISQDEHLKTFVNAEKLSEASRKMVDALSNENDRKTLIWELITIGDANRFLQKNFDTILAILSCIVDGKPICNDQMIFYASWPKQLKTIDSISGAEKFFLAGLKNAGGAEMINQELWLKLKTNLAGCYKTWLEVNKAHPGAEVGVQKVGATSCVTVSYPDVASTLDVRPKPSNGSKAAKQ